MSAGAASPVVHIHGFAISGAYLMPTARALAGRRVNLVPDLPGYGHSERRGKVLDIPALSEALLAVLDALEIEQAVLVGNSMGCPIGLEVAHVAPERVHSLVAGLPGRPGVQNATAVPRAGPAGEGRGSGEPEDVPGRAAGHT